MQDVTNPFIKKIQLRFAAVAYYQTPFFGRNLP
jgi:hypothetical protein